MLTTLVHLLCFYTRLITGLGQFQLSEEYWISI
jgi:hypothetical protein